MVLYSFINFRREKRTLAFFNILLFQFTNTFNIIEYLVNYHIKHYNNIFSNISIVHFIWRKTAIFK